MQKSKLVSEREGAPPSKYSFSKEVNRKVQGMLQSQTAANHLHQEEEKKDKNLHAQNKQIYEKHKDQLPRGSEC